MAFTKEYEHERPYDSEDAEFIASDDEDVSEYESDSDDDLICVAEGRSHINMLNQQSNTKVTRSSIAQRSRRAPDRFHDQAFTKGSGCFYKKGCDETDMSFDGRET